jgi:methionine aminopeptidase
MENFDLDKLNYLANHHKILMEEIKEKIETTKVKTNKDIYNTITDYINSNKLHKAFPVGISINNIIAHDSYHPEHLITLTNGDYIKVDFGLEEEGNIIDSARTFVYGENTLNYKDINDCKEIVENLENYINKELEMNNKILIQKISILTNIEITKRDYKTLDFLGGHNIEKGCVHGKKLILNKPLNLLPAECANHIDKFAELKENEMFALEVYIPNKKLTELEPFKNINSSGSMIQNIKIPITHYEIDKNYKINLLNVKERKIFNELVIKTKNLPYEYHIHDLYDKKIIKNLINKEAIIRHYPLEWVDKINNIKYIQYEDCYIIKNNKIINLTK